MDLRQHTLDLGPVRLVLRRQHEPRAQVLGRLINGETRTVAGETRTYLTTKGPHHDDQGRVVGVLGISHDITERKRAEAERERLLQEADVQRARLQAILDSLPVGVWIADATGKMVTVNEVAREIWGGRAPYAENVAGYQAYKAWWADTGELITAEAMPLARAIRGETMTGAVVNIERFDGTRAAQLISAAPVQDREGKTIGGIAIVQDITHLKLTEEALRESEERLRLAAEGVDLGIWDLDLRTNVAARTLRHDQIFGYQELQPVWTLEIALKHVLPEDRPIAIEAHAQAAKTGKLFHEVRVRWPDGSIHWISARGQMRYLQIIAGAVGRMGHLIDDLLALSRLGRAAMAEEEVDLGQLVEESRQELAPQIEGRAIEWQIGPLPQVRGDRTLLRNAIVNLLSNAIKYSRQRNPARIEMASQQGDDEVIWFVRDNGAGFDMRFASKLFGVFQRLHPEEQFEGTGVGLASVRRIIERHGGRVWAEAAVDQGATFYIALPAKRGS